MSERFKNPGTMGFALWNALTLYMHLREPGNVLEAAERLFTLASEQQLPNYVAVASVDRGWAMAEQGRTDEGIALIRAGLDSLVALGETENPSTLRWLSEAQARAGQIEEALATIEQAFSAVGEMQIHLAGVLWSRGELHLKRGDESKAAGDFREAIAAARRMGSKAYELRATTSLARLFDKRGRREEARAMLAEIYDWFTEGFDTADLKDAKALLDELSA
jgi:tetratricopeptide (TPR) repeat protein